MMERSEAIQHIEKILKAKKIEDILNPSDLKEEYGNIIKLIHPDICDHPKANEATAKLNELKENYTGKGTSYKDEAGEFRSNGYVSVYSGEKDLLQKSYSIYHTLKSFKDSASLNFHKYMPSEMYWKDDELEIKLSARAIPITGLTLEQVHVNWILSRMLEFSSWLSQIGFVHCGINPESVFIVPENHGIQVCSFYFTSTINKRIYEISSKYKSWYPPQLFDNKKAVSGIDLDLCMKTAIYLLGDKSGSGIKLRKEADVHQELLDFMIAQHYEPAKTWKEYRELLSKNFEKKFYVLDI